MKLAIIAAFLGSPLFGAGDAATLRVHLTERDGGKIVDLPLERYVAAVIAGEASNFHSTEALKAMAVAARSFAIRNRAAHAAQGYNLCGTTHCQLLDLGAITARFEQAAEATAGEMLWFEGKPAYACYSRNCGGRSEDGSALWPGQDVPYLKVHSDPYCIRAGASDWQWIGEAAKVAEALRRSGLRVPPRIESMTVSKRDSSGRAEILSVTGGGQSMALSADAVRLSVGRGIGWNTIRSDRFDVHGSAGKFLFQGTGSGHGAGLCQVGADQMGTEGHNYREILSHYYPGASLGLNARGLRWSRLGGERVSILTTQSDRDAALVAVADRIAALLSLPAGIEIRIYPDVEVFRNATAEPGWVAAHTVGRKIHIQRAAATRSTINHELLHIKVEEMAAPNLPVWFREGLVAFLAGKTDPVTVTTPDDNDLRQRTDAARARGAYEAARGRVAQLVQQYGESTVMGWLKVGIPVEVTRHRPS